ncbi:Transmembrane protein 118 [Schistosoma japonicum]|nr:Transmembrane protein 118 [Schistosoma japonicum]KAH8860353.1 Transmembrane protein 118 [Schistosoma japonicum]
MGNFDIARSYEVMPSQPSILPAVSTYGECSTETKAAKDLLFSFRNICHICFFSVIVLKLYGEYFSNIVLALWAYVTVLLMNSEIQTSFYDLSYRKICFQLSFVSLSHFGLIQYSLWSQGLYDVFLLQPSSSVSSLPLALWYIFISDCSLKLLLIFIKSTSLLSLAKTLDYYSTGSLLCFLEYVFLFLRHIPPGILWIYFLIEFNWKFPGVLAGRIFVCFLYCVLKICILFSLCKEFVKFSRSTMYKKPYTVESQTTSSEVCNMCLESYTHVGILSCSHTFCANCTARWCNTFTNCPFCHPEINENSKWRNGSMDLFIQFY